MCGESGGRKGRKLGRRRGGLYEEKSCHIRHNFNVNSPNHPTAWQHSQELTLHTHRPPSLWYSPAHADTADVLPCTQIVHTH